MLYLPELIRINSTVQYHNNIIFLYYIINIFIPINKINDILLISLIALCVPNITNIE